MKKAVSLLAKLMEEKAFVNSDERIWFSQLLGMSDHICFNLANAGYCVCKYVPLWACSVRVALLIQTC